MTQENEIPRCAACGFGFAPILHKHHIRPRSEGGYNTQDNLIHLCPNCHALVHQLYKWGFPKDHKERMKTHANYLILRNWIEENLGVLACGVLLDIAMKKNYQPDKRYGE